MTTAEIVREIERLPSEQKAEVLSALLRSPTKSGQLSPDELVALADRMVAANDPEEADRLQARFSPASTGSRQCRESAVSGPSRTGGGGLGSDLAGGAGLFFWIYGFQIQEWF